VNETLPAFQHLLHYAGKNTLFDTHDHLPKPFGRGPSFISHREHKGHRVLIWIALSAIQIKLLSGYRWKFAPISPSLPRGLFYFYFTGVKKSGQAFYLSEPCPPSLSLRRGRRVWEL